MQAVLDPELSEQIIASSSAASSSLKPNQEQSYPTKGESTTSKGLYDTLVRTGIEKRLTTNEKALDDLKAQLAKLEALKKEKQTEDGDPDKEETEDTSCSPTKGILIEREPENMLDLLMDDIFADMFAEMKGHRPTKAEIATFKSTQLDDYDAELEEFEMEAYDNDDEYYPEYDEYAYEEAERQRLLQEMLEQEDNFDVTTHNAVFFDVTPEMEKLTITKPEFGSKERSTGSNTQTEKKSDEMSMEVKAAVTNFKLNAGAKEWKPPGMGD